MWKSVKQPCTLMRQYLRKVNTMRLSEETATIESYIPFISTDVGHVFSILISDSLIHSLLNFGVMHVYDGISGVSLSLLEVTGPHVVHPVDQVHLDNADECV